MARAADAGNPGLTSDRLWSLRRPGQSRRGRLRGPGPRRGLSRVEALTYVGVAPSKFDQLVADGRMPQPEMINSHLVWDIRALDIAFDERAEPAGQLRGV